MFEEINLKFFRFFMRVLVLRKMNSYFFLIMIEFKNFEFYYEFLIFFFRLEEREKE